MGFSCQLTHPPTHPHPHRPSLYWYGLAVTMLNNLVAFYFAQFLAAAAPSSQVALAIFPVTFLFLTSFAGFTVPLQDVPKGWVWASYISYPRWCYEGLVASQFGIRIGKCGPNKQAPIPQSPTHPSPTHPTTQPLQTATRPWSTTASVAGTPCAPSPSSSSSS